jgi:ATP-binding cassette, subfamily B, bacterial PglK
MIDTFFKLFKLLTPKQKREFYFLQVFMLASSVTELVGTVSIMPFIALAANPEILDSNEYLREFHIFLGSPPHRDFLIYVAGVFVFFIVLSNLVLIFSQFFVNRYSFRLGGEISSRLFGYYLSKDILFHTRTNSASLIQRVMRDCHILSISLVAPALRLNSRAFSIFLLTSLIVIIDPVVAISTLVIIGLAYWFIFKVVRAKIYRNGQYITGLGKTRNQLLNEGFGGVRDLKLYALEGDYLERYRKDTKTADRAAADNQMLGEFPYYLVEAIVFTGMVLLTLYLYFAQDGLGAALPMLTLYGLAGIKIIPKVQQSYVAVTKIRGAQPAFRNIYPDLKVSTQSSPFEEEGVEPLRPHSSIELKNVTFGYGDDLPPVLEKYSTAFSVGRITAITGPSGVGKSTLLDILMGLVEPQSGGISIDGQPLSERDLPAWRAAIGYVPQEVYLTDTSPAENIAFGVGIDDIDMDRVKRAAKMARLHDFIESLPGGYEASIGERGSQFSGGQKQRIGLARAFYRDVSVLFLDEATSALDNETQAAILQNLSNEGGDLTVVMVTHRTETVSVADDVVELRAPGL